VAILFVFCAGVLAGGQPALVAQAGQPASARPGHADQRPRFAEAPVSAPQAHRMPSSAPRIKAPTAMVVNLATGRVLYEKHPDQRRPIASIAKIMTALVVLRHSSLDGMVRVTKRATRTDPINLGLKAGERISVRDLLYGLLLRSGNDTAMALAQHVSRTVPKFLALMDRTAHSLGATDTHFASPNGLNDHGYSTVTDVARIAMAAMDDPTFRRIVATRTYHVPGPKHQVHHLKNLNEMLFTYPHATGIKTGYTEAAGNCVVESASRGSLELVVVVLHDDPRTDWRDAYRDASRLLNYGFRRAADVGSIGAAPTRT